MAKKASKLTNGGRWYRKNRERILAERRAAHKARGGTSRSELRAKEEARYRLVLEIKAIKGQTFKTIGETLGISRNAVSGLVWRARNRLEARA
jgi:DNA-directed RNA polymerase specialized sigma subunit